MRKRPYQLVSTHVNEMGGTFETILATYASEPAAILSASRWLHVRPDLILEISGPSRRVYFTSRREPFVKGESPDTFRSEDLVRVR